MEDPFILIPMEGIPFGKFGFIKKKSWLWLRDHLFITLPVVALLIIILLMTAQWMRSGSPSDYLMAEMIYRGWEERGGRGFDQLERILHKYPELQVKYGGGVAQRLLASSQSGLATSYAKTLLKRTQDIAPYYTRFSEISLLIAEARYREALDNSRELKISLDRDDVVWDKGSFLTGRDSLLYIFNLLRIAILENVAGSPEGELGALQDLKLGLSSSKQSDLDSFALLQQNFQSQTITLLDYIQYREKLLQELN